MGAMLVCGVRPQDDATEIPTSARLLEDAMRPASGIQLHRARRVLEDWMDDHEEVQGGDVSGATLVTPMNFLLWCEDAFRGAVHEPQMLHEFLAYVTRSKEAGVQKPAPYELMSRVNELEGGVLHVGRISEPTHDFRGHLGVVLSSAYARAEGKKDRKNVFLALCELAQRQKPPAPLIGYDSSRRKVIYRDEEGKEKLYGVSDLRYRKEFRTS